MTQHSLSEALLTAYAKIAAGANPTRRRECNRGVVPVSDSVQLTYPEITTDGPEKHQAVYRQNFINVWAGGATAYKILLDYVVQTWAKVYHQSYPHEDVITLPNQTGETLWRAVEGGFKNWRISKVAFEIVAIPAGADMQFGQDPLIYAGKCSFAQALLEIDALDWSLPGTGSGAGGGDTAIGSTNDPSFATQGAAYFTINTMLGPRYSSVPSPVGTQFEISDFQPPNFTNGSFAFGASFTFKLGAKSQRPVGNKAWRYPLKYINFNRSIFDADNPNCSAVWWYLKPGVVANVTIYGMQVEPHVEISNIVPGG